MLAIPAAAVYAAFGGHTTLLIPLFAIGVFLAFTLAQNAMVVHWWRHRERGWRPALATNLLGGVLSAAVVLIALITKFAQGAWVVALLIPLMVLACGRMHDHYLRASKELTPRPEGPAEHTRLAPPQPASDVSAVLAEAQDSPAAVHSFAVVPVAVLDLAALHALAYAVSLAQPVLALHVSPSDDEAERFQQSWQAWGDHLPLEIVISPYRATVAPLANYIAALHRQRPGRHPHTRCPRGSPRKALAAHPAQPHRRTPARITSHLRRDRHHNRPIPLGALTKQVAATGEAVSDRASTPIS